MAFINATDAPDFVKGAYGYGSGVLINQPTASVPLGGAFNSDILYVGNIPTMSLAMHPLSGANVFYQVLWFADKAGSDQLYETVYFKAHNWFSFDVIPVRAPYVQVNIVNNDVANRTALLYLTACNVQADKGGVLSTRTMLQQHFASVASGSVQTVFPGVQAPGPAILFMNTGAVPMLSVVNEWDGAAWNAVAGFELVTGSPIRNSFAIGVPNSDFQVLIEQTSGSAQSMDVAVMAVG